MNTTITGHFGCVLEKKHGLENTWLSWGNRFQKNSVLKVFLSTQKRKPVSKGKRGMEGKHLICFKSAVCTGRKAPFCTDAVSIVTTYSAFVKATFRVLSRPIDRGSEWARGQAKKLAWVSENWGEVRKGWVRRERTPARSFLSCGCFCGNACYTGYHTLLNCRRICLFVCFFLPSRLFPASLPTPE